MDKRQKYTDDALLKFFIKFSQIVLMNALKFHYKIFMLALINASAYMKMKDFVSHIYSTTALPSRDPVLLLYNNFSTNFKLISFFHM